MNVCHETIRVLIVDDQRLVREILGTHLDTQTNIEVLDCAACGVEALEQIDRLNPDIAIVDLEMPGMSGITTIEIISERFPETKTIVLSSHGRKEYINQAITAGAKGYLIKGATPEEIAETIEKVHLGHFQLGSKLFERSKNINFSADGTFDTKWRTAEVLESEDNIPFIPTKVEVVKTSEAKKKVENNPESVSQSEFRKIRQDLLAILEFKTKLASKQKQQMQAEYQKLHTKFSWLVASQILLFIVTFGCISSLAKVNFKIMNLQGDITPSSSVQSVK